MPMAPFSEAISEHVWRTRYQWLDEGHALEPSIEATWDRVALAVSGAEAHHRHEWRERFRAILGDFRFLPGGRILAGAGTARRVTLFNCFALGSIEDSVSGIFNALRESMVTLQAGGGLGIDFSTLRPAGVTALSSGGVASGPLSYMRVWESATSVLETGNLRRGAMMATLRCDHPDVEDFVQAKLTPGALPHFKLSVLVTDDFLRAIEQDGPWPLVFPLSDHAVPVGGELCERIWPGSNVPQRCLVHRRVPARTLWRKLLQAQHDSAEPGLLFIDRINRANNLWYCEQLSTTNPCGEVPLPPNGCCNLGSINLTRFVQQPFSKHPSIDFGALKAVAAVATRFLDNIHDVSLYPLKAQEKVAHASRRLGLGVTGLADMFAMLGLRYGSPHCIELTRAILRAVRDTAYRTSIEIAREKGPFPAYDRVRFGASPFVLDLARDIQDTIARHGLRNSPLLAVAPAGSISLLANNISSGIEPILALQGSRRVRGVDGQPVLFPVQDPAWREYRVLHGATAPQPDYFVEAAEVDADDQLAVMSVVQSYVDSAISKTLHLPEVTSVQVIELDLLRAEELGLKGCAVCRDTSRSGASAPSAHSDRRQRGGAARRNSAARREPEPQVSVSPQRAAGAGSSRGPA